MRRREVMNLLGGMAAWLARRGTAAGEAADHRIPGSCAFDREPTGWRIAMKSNTIAAALTCLLATPTAASAEGADKISDGAVRIGLILDMSGPYADVTGTGSLTAARMAVEDVGGKVLGKPIDVLVADHQNKPDLASAKATEWFDREHLDALVDVAASSTALAAQDVAKQRNKIIILNGPATTRLTNESCGPQTVHYAYDTYALANGTGLAVVKQGGDSWFFLTVDYTFGHDLE